MKTQHIPKDYQHQSPAGAEVRLLLDNVYGGIAHCTLRDKKISRAVRHKTVSEFWHILSGTGAIWRKNSEDEQITQLVPGITIDIPLGTDFQYRPLRDRVDPTTAHGKRFHRSSPTPPCSLPAPVNPGRNVAACRRAARNRGPDARSCRRRVTVSWV